MPQPIARSSGTHPRRTRIAGAAIAVILGLGMSLGAAGAAHAVASMTVSIQATNATTQPSGAQFSYQINIACGGANDPSCNGTSIVIPLDATADGGPWSMTDWGFEVSGGPAGFVQGWSVQGDDLVIELNGSIPTGSSQSILLGVTPPNLQTPNGTTWSLLPSAVTDDPDTTGGVAPTAAVGTATAAVPLTTAKTSDRTFYAEGEQIAYRITATCPATKPIGSVYADTLTVVDVLPAGLTFDSASGGGVWNPADRTITWTYPTPESVPDACGGTPPAAASATQTVLATMGPVDGDPIPAYGQVTNTVTATATPSGGGDSSSATASRTIVALADGGEPIPGTHSLGKTSAAPLNRSADATPDFRATYPGRWLPNGDNSARPASMAEGNPASYRLQPRVQYEEHQYEIVDAVPCLTNGSGVLYRPVDSGVCAAPAFHVLGVRIDYSGVAPAAGYTPRFLDTEGAEYDLALESGTANWAAWTVPDAFIGDVAAVIIPRDASQERRTADNIRIDGFADGSLTDGAVLQNQASVEWFLRDGTTPVAQDESPNADVFVVNTPQIGIAKRMTDVGGATGTQARVDLTATLFTPGLPAADLIVTDLLPAGSALADDPDGIGAELRSAGGSPIDVPASELEVEVVDDAVGEQQLIRFTLPVEAIPAQSGRVDLVVDDFVVDKPDAPGIYVNAARVFYDSATLAGQCFAGSYLTDDPDGLRGDDSTVPASCEATAQYRTITSTSGQFQLSKSVQGDYDTAPQVFPHLGHVKLQDGAAVFGVSWQNVGAPALNGVVLYDVFPHVGDTGVSGDQADESRGSQFRPVLAGPVVVPPGVTVSYSASVDPCRPEVFVGQGACTDDWTTDPLALGGFAEVNAVRLVATGSYETGQGFELTFPMAIPSIDKDLVAWNTVAAYAQTTGGIALLPTESPRVGITGSDERLSLAKTVDAGSAKPGDTLTYRVTVTNVGTGTSLATTVTDALPEGITFVSADHGGSYDPGDRTVTWAVPELARDTEVVYTLIATVDATQDRDRVINRASLENPPGYSPPVVDTACDDDPLAACAPTTVPRTPRVLGFTGAELSTALIVAVVAALAAGTALVVLSRRRRNADVR